MPTVCNYITVQLIVPQKKPHLVFLLQVLRTSEFPIVTCLLNWLNSYTIQKVNIQVHSKDSLRNKRLSSTLSITHSEKMCSNKIQLDIKGLLYRSIILKSL